MSAYIVGVGMTPFGKHLSKSMEELTSYALKEALSCSGLNMEQINAVFFSNTTWGYFENQHSIRGEVIFRRLGIDKLPIVNIENACAGGSSALHLSVTAVKSGEYDCVLAVGTEKIHNPDREKMFKAFLTALDLQDLENHISRLRSIRKKGLEALVSKGITVPEEAMQEGNDKSIFMDIYSAFALWHMAEYGSTEKQLAAIASKNHYNGSLNPKAQIRIPMTPEEILKDRIVSWPLTRSMCAPIGDGSAAAIVVSERFVKEKGLSSQAIKILASVLKTGADRDINDIENHISRRASREAYERSGVGPDDIDLAEVHDATAFGELFQVEMLGFFPPGEGGIAAELGKTSLKGEIPINPSGGLECRGHPIGASGLAQIYELVLQLWGKAGKRQVEKARIALAENGGGNIGMEEAVLAIHILGK